ncbi:hypothetical protein PHLCEN_2v645 [Hermanssonia centrifuga]|uniref:Uncharacterized protein n=1 Tax=Hermanssonia centrifuga TaxID=98765 RepID=A0A2R6S579_9APHY|nr:hypothetical protein PHLCEN_2v645 [Hermanssonia centrifuga]
MSDPFRSEATSRKYIDLIYTASTTWANLDPSRKIEVSSNLHLMLIGQCKFAQPGDFGTIDSKTGRFEKHDSVYTNEQTTGIAKAYPPLRGENKAYKQVVSRNVRSLDFDVNPQV